MHGCRSGWTGNDPAGSGRDHRSEWICFERRELAAPLLPACKQARPASLSSAAQCTRPFVIHLFPGRRVPKREEKLCPKSKEEWDLCLQPVYSHLGLTGKSDLEKRVHNLFLQVWPT